MCFKFDFEVCRDLLEMTKILFDIVTWQIANSVLNKYKSVMPPLFNAASVFCFAADKAGLNNFNFIAPEKSGALFYSHAQSSMQEKGHAKLKYASDQARLRNNCNHCLLFLET